jgi:hypothetical protein
VETVSVENEGDVGWKWRAIGLGAIGIVATEGIFEWTIPDVFLFTLTGLVSGLLYLLTTQDDTVRRTVYSTALWISLPFFIGQGVTALTVTMDHNLEYETLQHATYIQANINYHRIPLKSLHSLITTTGVNSYSGQLLSREVINTDYSLPYYCETGLKMQRDYVASLEKAHLINGVPLKMEHSFSIPNYQTVKTVRGYQSVNKYSTLSAGKIAELNTMSNTINQLANGSAFLNGTLPIAKLERLRVILKKYNPTESVRTIFTENLGTTKLISLYTRATTAYSKLNECYTALGKNNKECVAHEKEMSKL